VLVACGGGPFIAKPLTPTTNAKTSSVEPKIIPRFFVTL
jgi:hypothetical protein